VAGLLNFTITLTSGNLTVRPGCDHIQELVRLIWAFAGAYTADSAALRQQNACCVLTTSRRQVQCFRLGYARAIVTPYNENLFFFQFEGIGGFGGSGSGDPPAGYRDSLQRWPRKALREIPVCDCGLLLEYTNPDYDSASYSAHANSPRSVDEVKIDGVAARCERALTSTDSSAVTVLGRSRDRFFPLGPVA